MAATKRRATEIWCSSRVSFRRILGLGIFLGLAATPAFAQKLNSGQGLSSSEQLSQPSSVPPLPAPESLFPSLFGVRSWLTDHGIAVLVDTTNEFGANVTGGGGPASYYGAATTKGGAAFDGQVGFETDINWEKLAGVTGLSTNTIVVARYGGVPSSELIGDIFNSNSEIYGAGGNVVAHLVQFSAQETLASGRVQIQVGRIPLDDYFNSSPLFCNYAQNTICGNPKAFSDDVSGHITYPDAGWALHLLLAYSQHYYMQTGIFFDQSNTEIYGENDRSGFTFDDSYINGETFPVEFAWVPSLGRQHLPGHYKAGFVYDDASFSDNYFSINGAPFAANGLSPRRVKGSTTEYFQVDQMLMRNGPGPNQGLIVLAGYTHNDPETSLRTDQFYLGLQDQGFWAYRPQDQINLLASRQTVSGLIGKSQALEFDEGLPLYDISAGASGIQTWQMTFEANYAITLYHGVTFAPDFQYYIRPNAQSNLPDAAFLGFKSHIEIF